MGDLRYPIGEFNFQKEVNENLISLFIDKIEELPQLLKKAIGGLKEDHLDSPYRPGGWTIRQIVHHIADANMNAYIRVKLAMTEDKPTIKPFEEVLWAELDDSQLPVEISINLLEALHKRWVILLRSITSIDRERAINHPVMGQLTINQLVELYSWHGNHHLAHITSFINRMESN